MCDSQEEEQQLKLVNLEKRVATVEKLLKIMDSELNNKIRWIIKTVGISNGQGEDDEDEPGLRPLPPRARIIHRQIQRKPSMMFHRSSLPAARFVVPEVQMRYDDDDGEEDEYGPDEDFLEDDSVSDWQADKAAALATDIEENDDGADDDYYDESASRANPDPLAVELELVEEENEDQTNVDGEANPNEDDETENETRQQNPWRFSADGNGNDNEQDQDQNQEEEDDSLSVAHFMDVSQLKSSVTRRPPPATGNLLRARIQRGAVPYTNKFRLIQAARSNNKSKPRVLTTRTGSEGVSSRVIVPRNRYLMPSTLASRLQQQTNLGSAETKLNEVKSAPKARTGTGTSTSASGAGTGTGSDAKEKVYFCDRCPLTFTLSTRHAHYELHKQMDLGKRLDKNKGDSNSDSCPTSTVKNLKNRKTSSRSLLKPISSLSPPRKTRIRPRKVCPVCPKSYSRNQYLRNHLQEHADEFPYICKECFIVLPSEKELEVHCQGSDRCFISTYQPCI